MKRTLYLTLISRRKLLVVFIALISVVVLSLLVSAVDRESPKKPEEISLKHKRIPVHAGTTNRIQNLKGYNERRNYEAATLRNNIHLSSAYLQEDILPDESKTFKGLQPGAVTTTMAANKQLGFDPTRVLKLFCSCRGADDVIFINCYVDAYEELCKLFRLFGTIFGFVTSDVEEKTGILRDYNSGEQSQDYKTVQSMLDFELSNNLTDNKKKPSGARTLLRLHRAMEFISSFLQKLKESNSTVKFSSRTCEAYDTTLAKHHPWLIRKAVHVALYMLPTRQDLLKKMGVEDNEAGMQGMTDLISELNTIFNIVEKLYVKDNLLDLP